VRLGFLTTINSWIALVLSVKWRIYFCTRRFLQADKVAPIIRTKTHYCQTATLWFNIDISRKKSLVFYFLPSVLFILNILNKIPANLQNGNPQTYSKYLIAVVNQGLLHVILCLSIPTWAPRAVNYTRKNSQVVTSLQTSCYKSVQKLSTSCVRTACSQLLEQVWNKLLTTCIKQAWWHYQTCYKIVLTSLIQSWYNKNVTRLF
jgi:hypothetical protein